MKEALVNGLNEWLLNASPTDRRYPEMEALRDTIEGALEGSELLATIQEYKEKPRPVAKGFAFDFELSESQNEQVNWTLANSPDKWLSVLKLLASFDVKITYGEEGGPYQPEED